MKPPLLAILIATTLLAGAGAGYFFAKGSKDSAAVPNGSGPAAAGNNFTRPTATLVETAPVVSEEVYEIIESLGTLTANESLTITAKVTETVRKLHFEDGDLVTDGDILAELTDYEQSALLAEAQANLGESQRQLKRLTDIGTQLASESAIDQAEAVVSANQARLNAIIARMEDRLIRAPFSGLLGFRLVSPGTLLTPGTAITTLDDIQVLKLDFSIPETLLGSVNKGAKVIAYSSAWPERNFVGEVSAIDSRINPVTRAAMIRAEIPNQDLILRPGMLMTTEVVTNVQQALTIPESALIQNASESYVYVVDENLTVQRRDIDFDRRWRGKIILNYGLDEAEEIVTAGAFKLRPNATVRIENPLADIADNALSERPETERE